MAQEVLAGTREISGSSAVSEPPAAVATDPAQEAAQRQAMEVTTPEVMAHHASVERGGTTTSTIEANGFDVGVGSRSIESLPDPLNARAVEEFREEKRVDIKGPGE